MMNPKRIVAIENVRRLAPEVMVATHMRTYEEVAVDVESDGYADIYDRRGSRTIWYLKFPTGCNCDWCADWRLDEERFRSDGEPKGPHNNPQLPDDLNLYEEYDGDKEDYILDCVWNNSDMANTLADELEEAVRKLPFGYFGDEECVFGRVRLTVQDVTFETEGSADWDDLFRIARYVDLPAVEEKFSHESGDTAEVDVFYDGYHYALLRYKGYGNTYVRRV